MTDTTPSQDLESAIQKWEQIVSGDLPLSAGVKPCDPCGRWFSAATECDGCPVSEQGGYCLKPGTPHYRFAQMLRHLGPAQMLDENHPIRDVAREMLQLLIDGRQYIE